MQMAEPVGQIFNLRADWGRPLGPAPRPKGGGCKPPRRMPSCPTNSATAAIQKARKGRSVSSELPFTTKAGTAMNNSAAQSGCGEKRRARDHMDQAATREN